ETARWSSSQTTQEVRAADAKEVGVGNPAEETYCHPNSITLFHHQAICQLVIGARDVPLCPRAPHRPRECEGEVSISARQYICTIRVSPIHYALSVDPSLFPFRQAPSANRC